MNAGEALFVSLPRPFDLEVLLEALRGRIRFLVERADPRDVRQAGWALEELLRRSSSPVSLRQELLLWSTRHLVLLRAEIPRAKEFLFGVLLPAPLSRSSLFHTLPKLLEGKLKEEEMSAFVRTLALVSLAEAF